MRGSISTVPTNAADAWLLPDPYAGTRAQARAVRQHRRLSGTAAATALTAAVLVGGWPDRSVTTLGAIVGAWLVGAGILHLAEAGLPDSSGAAPRTLSAVTGVLYLVAGVLALRGMAASVEPLALGLGIVWLAGGLSTVVAATCAQLGGWPMRGALATGTLLTAAGAALAFWPRIDLAVLAVIAAVALAGVGAIQASMAMRAARLPAC